MTMYESDSPFDFLLPPAGGGAGQAPYGNAPVLPAGLEGSRYMSLIS